MVTYYADVILPLHIHGTYTYRVPQEYNDDIRVGQRVVVQFGPRKLYSAVVRRLHEEVPHYRVKYILAILDAKPIVSESLFRFWEWIADYYMCYVGDVMAIALPTAFRLASESSVSIHPDYTGELSDLSANEMRVVQLLSEHPVMTVDDLGKALTYGYLTYDTSYDLPRTTIDLTMDADNYEISTYLIYQSKELTPEEQDFSDEF